MIKKIISGGQTGADRAALDAAIELGISHGGWITKNGIEILNVAGPRASKDPSIYGLVTVILELVITLKAAKSDKPDQARDLKKLWQELKESHKLRIVD